MDTPTTIERQRQLAEQYFSQARCARAPEDQAFLMRMGEAWLSLAAGTASTAPLALNTTR